MTPPTVDAPDLTGLIELSRDPQLDLKPVVLRVQTDLFLAAPIRDRAALEAFAALAGGLIPTVDEETALTVARKLGPCADTPQSVLLRLVERGGAIGRAVLDTAATLSDPVITAARVVGLQIGTPTIVQIDTAPEAAPETAAMNDPSDCPSDTETFSGLLTKARHDPEAARQLLARADLAPADLAPLWLHAEPRRRSQIAEALSVTSALRPSPPAPRGLGPVLTELASAHDIAGFVTALTESLGLSGSFLAAAPDPSSRYDLLTLAMRAADLSEADSVFVFLTLNATVARSVERVFQLARLYRTTSRATARDLLSAILDIELPERGGVGTHQPYHGPEAGRPRHSAATERALERAVAPHRLRRIV